MLVLRKEVDKLIIKNRTMSSCWTSDKQVRTNAVVSILSLIVAFEPFSAKLPSSFCWLCIHIRADLSNPGSEYLCSVMDDRAWTVRAVSLQINQVFVNFNWFLIGDCYQIVSFDYLRSDEPSTSWNDPSANLKLKMFWRIPFQLASSLTRFFLVYWSWWKRSKTVTKADGSDEPNALQTSSKLEAIPPVSRYSLLRIQ